MPDGYDNDMEYLLPAFLSGEFGGETGGMGEQPAASEVEMLNEYLESLGIIPRRPRKEQVTADEEMTDEEFQSLMNSIFR